MNLSFISKNIGLDKIVSGLEKDAIKGKIRPIPVASKNDFKKIRINIKKSCCFVFKSKIEKISLIEVNIFIYNTIGLVLIKLIISSISVSSTFIL